MVIGLTQHFIIYLPPKNYFTGSSMENRILKFISNLKQII